MRNVFTPSSQNYKANGSTTVSKKTAPSETIYHLDVPRLEGFLKGIPKISSGVSSEYYLEIPSPNGSFEVFQIYEASIFEDGLAAKYPQIRSYMGIGTIDQTARARFSLSPYKGLGMVISSQKGDTRYINPWNNDLSQYRFYSKSTIQAGNGIKCTTDDTSGKTSTVPNLGGKRQLQNGPVHKLSSDDQLRVFRLAPACTGEFSQYHLNRMGIPATASDAVKKAAVLAEITDGLTRVSNIFERDLGFELKIVDNVELIIFLNPSTDGYNGNFLSENVQINSILGTGSYDVGHVLAQGPLGGAAAALDLICGPRKYAGFSRMPQPTGFLFYEGYIAHELGHQFGAGHTQGNSCNRFINSSKEPGSGSTIMSYAGICAPNVLPDANIEYFHAVSIQQMWNASANKACAVLMNLGNKSPQVDAGPDVTIPASTPFKLRGSATDPNTSDILTYSWEQMDSEIASVVSSQPIPFQTWA